MNLYETLGVPRDATQAQIKKAYKKLAQRLHPDKPTGDAEKFQAIQHAYEILSDENNRAHYDRTGSDKGAPDYHSLATAHLSGLFSDITSGDMRFNIITEAKGMVAEKLAQFRSSEISHKANITKAEKHLNRVKTRKNENIFKMVLDARIATLKSELESFKHNMLILETMQELLQDYEDTKPEQADPFEKSMLRHFGRFNRGNANY